MHHYDDVQPKIRRAIRAVLARERFESYADLKDAVRRRLNALRLVYTPSEFDDALTRVDREEHPIDVSHRIVRAPRRRGALSTMEAWAQRYAETTRRDD